MVSVRTRVHDHDTSGRAQILRLLLPPGVTAAATTAVLATGAPRPGVTAEATTAVFATGAPMTPTRPTRPGLMGMSDSYRGGGLVGVDRGDDGLNGNPSVGDELATGTSRCRSKGGGPQVLPDEYAGSAPGLHRGGELRDVVLGEQFRQLGLECLQVTELADIGQLHGFHRAVVVLGEDQHVDHADDAGVDQRDQFLRHSTGEVGCPGRKLDHHVVNWTKFL